MAGVEQATIAVQSLERLLFSVREARKENRGDSPMEERELATVKATLEAARAMKEEMERKECGVTQFLRHEKISYTHKELSELQRLVVTSSPSTMTEERATEMAEMLRKDQAREGREVIFAVLECDSWYEAAVKERSASGRHTTLFFVYRRSSHLLLSHKNAKARDESETVAAVLQQGDTWLEGRELRWLCGQIASGTNARVTRALLASQASQAGQTFPGLSVICTSPAWDDLQSRLFSIAENGGGDEEIAARGPELEEERQAAGDDAESDEREKALNSSLSQLLVTQRLLSVCVAQAMGMVSERDKRVKAKKRKNKKSRKKDEEPQCTADGSHLRLNSAARQDIFLLCQAWSLLTVVTRHLSASGNALAWDSRHPEDGEKIAEEVKEAWELIQEIRSVVKPAAEDKLFVSLRHLGHECQELILKSSISENMPKAIMSQELTAWIGATREEAVEEELERSLEIRPWALPLVGKYPVGDSTVSPCRVICDTDEKLTALLAEIGAPLSEQEGALLYLAEGGSRMYNLAMENSDSDYVGVYLTRTSSVLGQLSWSKESLENKGHQARIEHCCYEARMMGEMILKGNPNVMELLFAPAASYCSPEFEILRQHRRRFVSELAVAQYESWTKWHLARIGKTKKEQQKPKLFYHALHKLVGLQALAAGKDPVVVMEDGPTPLADSQICGEIRAGRITRDVIIRIRRGNLTGPMAPELLLAAAAGLLTHLRGVLHARTWRYPEVGDEGLVTRWLLQMRLDDYHKASKQGLRWSRS